jgi:serpin B
MTPGTGLGELHRTSLRNDSLLPADPLPLCSGNGFLIGQTIAKEDSMRSIHGVVGLLMAATVAVIVIPGSVGCASAAGDKDWVPQAITGVAVDMYPRLGKGDDNLFFSPYSISAALAMTYAGARGETAAQMANVLHLPSDRVQRGGSFASLARDFALATAQGKVTFDIANALWGQKGFPFLPEYLSLISSDYGGRLTETDFQHEPESARSTINRWVEEMTHGKIVELIPPGEIKGDARLVLTNAIYFKGTWSQAFPREHTRNAPFITSDGSRIEVPTMARKGTFGYFGGEGFQALELPYEGGEISMVVFLPTEIEGLAQFERSVTLSKLEAWLQKLHPQDIWVHLPRFTISSPSSKLGPVLSAMGMTDAFTAKADFSGMDGQKDVFLQEVFHKAFVEVNEEGTEAAAATGAVVALKSSPSPVPEFRADHPFMFLIRHNPTNCILFMGRLAKP